MASTETDCKSDQQGSQSSCSEPITFYLVLNDTIAETFHSVDCYQTNKSCGARQVAGTHPAAGCDCEQVCLASVQLLGMGCCNQSVNSVSLRMLFRWKTDFLALRL